MKQSYDAKAQSVALYDKFQTELRQNVSNYFQSDDVKQALLEVGVKLDGKCRVKTYNAEIFIYR